MRLLAQRAAAGAQRQLARRSSSTGGIVVVYHALGGASGNPRRDLVPALAVGVFRAQLDHLERRYEVVPLIELPARVAARSSRGPVPVALRFDDDLASHLDHAAPLMFERGLPATFFLTGRTLDGPDAFWWQDLQSAAESGFAAVRERLADDWPWAARAAGVHDLARTVERLPPAEGDRVAATLRDLAAGAAADPGLPAAAVRELAGAGFDIGFHTRGHHSLPALDDRELAAAMHDGRDELEAAAGGRSTSIAYPYGHGDLRVAEAARRAGFELGLTWTGGPVRAGDEPLLLDCADGWAPSAEAFARRLARVAAAR